MTAPAAAGTQTRVLVVFASDRGSTRRMAGSVADGARSVVATRVAVRELVGEGPSDGTPDETRECDALILGSPMRHRSMHHRVKRYVEDVLERLWLTDETVGKVGGVFTVGGGHGNNGAGAEMAQLGMLAAVAANGMVLVSHPKCTPGADVAGSHWGPSGRTGGVKMAPVDLTDEMLQAGWHHGANVARVAAALRGRDLFARGNVAPAPEVLRLFTGAPPPPDAESGADAEPGAGAGR